MWTQTERVECDTNQPRMPYFMSQLFKVADYTTLLVFSRLEYIVSWRTGSARKLTDYYRVPTSELCSRCAVFTWVVESFILAILSSNCPLTEYTRRFSRGTMIARKKHSVCHIEIGHSILTWFASRHILPHIISQSVSILNSNQVEDDRIKQMLHSVWGRCSAVRQSSNEKAVRKWRVTIGKQFAWVYCEIEQQNSSLRENECSSSESTQVEMHSVKSM